MSSAVIASENLTAIPLMQIISGFWASKTLAAAVDLDLFSTISRRGVDTQDLAQSLGIHPRPAEMLCSGCAALGLLEKREGRFYNSPDSVRFAAFLLRRLERMAFLWGRSPETRALHGSRPNG